MKCHLPWLRCCQPAIPILFFILAGLKVQGQELAPKFAVNSQPHRLDTLQIPRNQVGIGMFAEGFSHVGPMLSGERLLAGKQKIRTTRRGKYKRTTIGLSAVIRVGAYLHRRNHTGINAWPGLMLTRSNKNGWFFSLGLFAGYQHRFLNEDTYTVDASGTVSRVRGAGNSMFATGLSTRFGKNLAVKRPRLPLSWYVGSNTYWVMPHNNSAVQQSAMEIGILYHLWK